MSINETEDQQQMEAAEEPSAKKKKLEYSQINWFTFTITVWLLKIVLEYHTNVLVLVLILKILQVLGMYPSTVKSALPHVCLEPAPLHRGDLIIQSGFYAMSRNKAGTWN